MAALKGQALLDYLAANEGKARDTLIEGAGYTILRNGRVSLQRTKFFEALAEANGHTIVSPLRSAAGNGKVPTYRLKVGPTGLVPVSGAYTSLCNMEPGGFVKVIIEDGVIILEAEEAPAPSCPPTPPVAQLASVV